MVRRLVLPIALVCAFPASASAADVSVDGGLLRFSAAPGKVNNVTFEESTTTAAEVTITTGIGDEDPLVAGAGCTAIAATVVCSGVMSALIDAGDGADRITAGWRDGATFRGLSRAIPAVILGGDGNDALAGGGGNDRIEGGPGNDELNGFPGNDALVGGDGNDRLRPDVGTDSLTGGDGIDAALYGRRSSPSYSLDGLANDGEAGENDLIGADVESIEAAANDETQTVTLTGDGRANTLTVLIGRGIITGGEGADVLEGGPQDDLIDARDGSQDVVICNGGVDTVNADTLDLVSPSCEVVSRQASPGGPFDDRPPSLAWSSPGAGASLPANTATGLAVDVGDDRGVANVRFFAGERPLCDDAVAPYACAFQPRGDDVGRTTLIAVATDTANQTTSVVRTVTIRRFASSSLTLKLSPRRDRRAPYAFRITGRLARPDTVSPSQGCSGTVTVSAKRGKKTVSTRRASLRRTCEYSATFRFKTRVAKRLRLQAKFAGNDVIEAKSSRTHTARLG